MLDGGQCRKLISNVIRDDKNDNNIAYVTDMHCIGQEHSQRPVIMF